MTTYDGPPEDCLRVEEGPSASEVGHCPQAAVKHRLTVDKDFYIHAPVLQTAET